MELWLVLGVSCLALVCAALLAPRHRAGSSERPERASPRIGTGLVVRCGIAGAVLLVVHDAERPAQGALACLAFALGVAAAVCAASVASSLSDRAGPPTRAPVAVALSTMAFVLSGAALACLAVLVLGPAIGLPSFGVSGPPIFPAFALGACLAGGSDLVVAMALESAAALVAASALYDANWERFGIDTGPAGMGLLVFPLVVRAQGMLASVVGLVVPNALWVMVALVGAAALGASYWTMGPYWLPFALAGVIGAIVAGGVTRLARTGGGEPVAPWLAILAVAVAAVTSYELGEHSGLSGAGFFGTACASSAALGMSGYAMGLGAIAGESDGQESQEADGYAAGASALAAITGVLAWIHLSTTERAARWADRVELPKRPIGELLAQYLASSAAPWPPRPDAIVCGTLAGAALALWGWSRGTSARVRGLALALLGAVGLTFRFALDGGEIAVAAMLVSAVAVTLALGAGLVRGSRDREPGVRELTLLLVAGAVALVPLLA